MTSKVGQQAARAARAKADHSQMERATRYVEEASRVRLQDIKDNPGAKVSVGRSEAAPDSLVALQGRQVRAGKHNQAGHTIGELQRAAKPPLGWIWGNFYRPWQRMFPGERHFNGDVNLRREYVPLSLLELQRMADLNWLRTDQLVDLTQLCNTRRLGVKAEWRQFGIHLTDEARLDSSPCSRPRLQGAPIFAAPINLEVQWASQTAIAAVERAGGRIRLAYLDVESVRVAADPQSHFEKGLPIPRRKLPPHSLISFYSNPKNRG